MTPALIALAVATSIGSFRADSAPHSRAPWTSGKLKAAGPADLLPGHCTGVEAAYGLRELAGLTRKTAVVSAVGSTFARGLGITALPLAG